MPVMFKHVPCSACGHRHHFCLTGGELTAGRRYEYHCPETGTRAFLQPDSGGEAVAFPTQGAVALTPADDGPGSLREAALSG
jgi:hypothetical protein